MSEQLQDDDAEWLMSCVEETVLGYFTTVNFKQRAARIADRLTALNARVQELEGALRTCGLAALVVSGSLNPDIAAAYPAIRAALTPSPASKQ